MSAETARVSVRGVPYFLRVWGEGPALLLLHGFTGTGATWLPFRSAWAGFRCIAPDLLGHGDSGCPSNPGRYTMDQAAGDVLGLLDALAVPRAAVLGYSMGGRVAFHLALAAPGRLWALVAESASPGIEDPAEREARRLSDETLARAIQEGGVTAFVERWQSQPLFASQQRLPDAVRAALQHQRMSHSPGGLANVLRGMGAGAHGPLWGRLRDIPVPVLLLAGEHDEKYRGIAQRAAALLPCARAEVVPGAGHAVHLERPAAFARAVRSFLEECLVFDRQKEVAPCP